MPDIVLRDYQSDAIAGLKAAWRAGSTAPLIVAPTGAGKSVLIAECIRLAMQRPSNRVAMFTHVKELIVQNLNELRRLAPDLALQTGVLCAGLNARDADRQITFASVQTACRADLGSITLAIIDEAHLIPRRAASMYGRLFEQLRTANPKLFLVGLTATPYRLDSGLLTAGDGALFDSIAHEVTLEDLIDRGHLVKPVTSSDFEMSGMVKRAGEYTAASQAHALQQSMDAVIADIVEHTADKRTLIFCPRIRVARQFAERLSAAGLSAETVSSRDDAERRTDIIAAFAAGEITHLTNVNLLTTGSNIPAIEAICLCRATCSPGLYVQMVGRGLRTHAGKSQCLVRDFGGNAMRHGPLGFPEVQERDASDAAYVPRTCGGCGLIVPSYPCRECGYQPPVRDVAPKLLGAWSGDIIGNTPTVLRVTSSSVKPWLALNSSVSTIAVECELEEVFCNRHFVTKWLCPLHQTRARRDYDSWRRKAGLNGMSPATISGAIDEMYAAWPAIHTVSVIRKRGEKYPRVVDVEFADDGRRFATPRFMA